MNQETHKNANKITMQDNGSQNHRISRKGGD